MREEDSEEQEECDDHCFCEWSVGPMPKEIDIWSCCKCGKEDD